MAFPSPRLAFLLLLLLLFYRSAISSSAILFYFLPHAFAPLVVSPQESLHLLLQETSSRGGFEE